MAASVANLAVMGWVVSAWRPEGLAPLVLDSARAAARGVRDAAERDARRLVRAARRERSRTEGELQQLEDMGNELLQSVREQRRRVRAGAMPCEEAPAVSALRARDLRGRRTVGGGRSRMHESPLAELFRATS